MVERHVQISGLRFIYFMVKNNEYKNYENYNDASGKSIDGDCCGNPSNVKIWNRSIYMHESWSKWIFEYQFWNISAAC